MLSKNEVKYIQSLYHKKTREAEGVFVVEGPKIVEEILASDYEVVKLYATDEWQHEVQESHEISRVDEDALQRISGLQTANIVLAVVKQRKYEKPELKGTLTLALDGIQDPGNFGTIIRIADWFGIRQIIASNDTVEMYNSKVIQSTMGSFIRVGVWYDDLTVFLKDQEVPVYGALLNGSNILQLERIREGVIVIGNESKGIRDAVKALIDQPVTIPKYGGAESLNAAVATGIILSHLVLPTS